MLGAAAGMWRWKVDAQGVHTTEQGDLGCVAEGVWITSHGKGTRKLLDGLCLSWVARPCGERVIASKGRLVLPLPVSMRSAREGEE